MKAPPPDIIIINNLRVKAILGILPIEREQAQEVIITIEIESDCSTAAATKDLADSVDYALLADEAIDITIQGKYLLIETLIEDLAQHCLNQPLVQAVSVKIEKPEAIETADSVGISIYRSN